MKKVLGWFTFVLLCGTAALAAEPDILVADFEGETYGDWKAEGRAFGPGPARGTLPHQMEVSGFEGRCLVNSFFEGDGTIGTLASPPLTIQRRYLNFLVGGGGHAEKTCINLLVDGRVVRTATGPNTQPGGSEALDWHSWDVAEFQGRQAVLQIVDQATGGWGHINVDQILQSDRKTASVTLSRELLVDKPFLHLPVKTGAPKRVMRLIVDGQLMRQFEIELAEGEPEFRMYTGISEWQGRQLRIEVDRMRAESPALAGIVLADSQPEVEGLYREPLRPQFHFSPDRGWTNDPNGLVYYDGEYHLFFQHNPYGVNWGNMTWGHAVSTDLFHWQQLPDAIHLDALGTIFSGSAVVDQNNSAGWQTGPHKPLVCIYTAAGGTSAESQGQPFTQAVAYSNDRGRTWTKYANNPILGHIAGSNRDPKVLWHELSKQWIMALFLDGEQYALLGSTNLKDWTRLGDIPPLGCGECPDFFELPVDGDRHNTRWVFWGGSGNYLVGRFDGKAFTKESGPFPSRFGAHDYAAQTYSDIPAADGRRIQISWMAGGRYPGMPFNQQMTVPRVLTLRTTSEGIRLFIEPVKEVETLRAKEHTWENVALGEKPRSLEQAAGDLFDIDATFEPGSAAKIGVDVRGHKIEYAVKEAQLTALGKSAALAPEDGVIRLRILVDRTSLEVFANGGRVQMAGCFLPAADNTALAVYADGGSARLTSLKVWELKSVWQRQ